MSVTGYDLDRIGDPISRIATQIFDVVKAYRDRTKVMAYQVDALNRIAAAMERENE